MQDKITVLQIRIPESLKKRAQRKAKKEYTTLSAKIRTLLDSWTKEK